MTRFDRLLEAAKKIVENGTPQGLSREDTIDWVWGNLAASSHHRVSRQVVEAVIDQLEKSK